MAKEEKKIILERTYNVPLRKEYMKAPRWKRTQKAVVALQQFLSKHMKSEDVKIGKEINELLWLHGIKNPPHHVKIIATKDDKGVVKAELFDVEKKKSKEDRKKKEKKTETKETSNPKQEKEEQKKEKADNKQ